MKSKKKSVFESREVILAKEKQLQQKHIESLKCVIEELKVLLEGKKDA